MIRLLSRGSLFLTAKIHCGTLETNQISVGRSSAGTRTQNENASPQRRHAPERGNRLGVAG
jgi:hypothetical protein